MSQYFEKRLTEAGLKKTKHRLLVLNILNATKTFLSMDDIFNQAIKVEPTISFSTVYRILEMLSSHHIVKEVNVDISKQTLYELAHDDHTHHLICLRCHKVIHVEGCPIHDYQDAVASKHNFTMTNHNLDFYGYCKQCETQQNK